MRSVLFIVLTLSVSGWAQAPAPKCDIGQMFRGLYIANQLLTESEPTNAALAEAEASNAASPVFVPLPPKSAAWLRACNWQNGLGREFTAPERFEFLEFLNETRVVQDTGFHHCVEFESARKPPAILFEYYGLPDLQVSRGAYRRLCWCHRGDNFLGSSAPPRKPSAPTQRLPPRLNRQTLMAEFQEIARLCGIGQ